MQDLLMKLTPFMQRANEAKLTVKLSMAEENIYDLLFDDEGETVGIIQLLGDDQLKMFGSFCEDEEPEETMTKEEIRAITKSFIKELFPEAVSVLHLDSITDLDVFYVFEYVQKDERYHLSMPNSGVIFFMYKNGTIMDMTNHMNGFTAHYPETILDVKRAKEIYMADVKPELRIVRHGGETYPNGDDSFVLVYDFIQTVGIDVKMNEKKITLEDMGVEKNQYSAIREMAVERAQIYSLINLHGMEKIVEDGAVEVWSTHSRTYYEENEELSANDLSDMDWGIADVVKIMTDCKRGMLRRVVTDPVITGERKWTVEASYEEALRILFSQYPSAHLAFKRREDDPAVVDYDDKGEELTPHAYRFTFDRFEGGIQVLEEWISITVSALTGELIEYDASEHVYEDFSSLVVTVPSYAEKALVLYENAFEMKLHWAKEYKDDGIETYYELVYLPVFEGAGGHIHFINAKTMELWIADTDGLEEF